MINILKFIVLYLYKTIINNPWKLIFTAITITSFTFADTFSDSKRTLVISDSLNLNHTYQYVYQDVNGGDIEYKIHNSDKPLKVSDGKIELLKYNDINIVVWVIFGISLLISVILNVLAITNSDVDSEWDWNESFDYALEWFTKTYKEGDEYYYYAFGKLLEKSRRHDDGTSSVGSLRKLKKRPNYEPVEKKRDRLIENILK